MKDEPAAPDAGLEAFVAAIEAALRARRGKEHVLSPRDFALARGWHEAGVPLATVLVGIDAAFERDPHTASLAPCRRRVEELAARGRPGRASRPARPSGRASPRWRSASTPCASAWSSCPGGRRRCPSRSSRRCSDLVAVASRPNWDYLRERLRRIDDLVAGAAVEALVSRGRRGPARGGRARGRAPPGQGRRAARSRRRSSASCASAPARRCACRGCRSTRPRATPCRARSTAAPRKRTPSFRSRRRWICGPGPPRGEMRPPAPTTRCQGTRPACASGSARSAQPTARAPRGTPSMTATWP